MTDNIPAVTPEAKPTTRKLGDRTLKRTSPMMTGEDVVELQTRLNTLGFDCGKVDGEFGKNTEKGVKAFQTAAKIEVDGKFGKKSMAALTAYSKPHDEPEKVEPEQPTYASYVVQSGDSLWKIAKDLLGDGKRWTEIAALNKIENTIIRPGDVLKIPQ